MAQSAQIIAVLEREIALRGETDEPAANAHDASDNAFVLSTPVRQVMGAAVPFTVSKGTPARYAYRLNALRELILQLQLEYEPELVNQLVIDLSVFIDEFQGMHIDLVKLKNHLEMIRERELDLANSELEALRLQHEAFINAANDKEDELASQVVTYQANISQLRSQLENFKDKELDLATSELGDLQRQWEGCMNTQDEYIRMIAEQNSALVDLSAKLKAHEDQSVHSQSTIESLNQRVCSCVSRSHHD